MKISMDFTKGCEICDKDSIAFRREDNVYICDKCNKKYPIKGDDEGTEKNKK